MPTAMIFARHHRHQSFDTFARRGFFVKRRRAENVALQPEQFAVHHFGVENFVAFLEPSDGSHVILDLRFAIHSPPGSLPRKSRIVNRKSHHRCGNDSSFRLAGRLGIRHSCRPLIFRYITGVNHLTKQEQMFLIVVLGLLLTGWAVKCYRTAHPPTVVAVQPAKP